MFAVLDINVLRQFSPRSVKLVYPSHHLSGQKIKRNPFFHKLSWSLSQVFLICSVKLIPRNLSQKLPFLVFILYILRSKLWNSEGLIRDYSLIPVISKSSGISFLCSERIVFGIRVEIEMGRLDEFVDVVDRFRLLLSNQLTSPQK
jgi:hypothetical protein